MLCFMFAGEGVKSDPGPKSKTAKKMKYNAAKIAECVAWVEKNGLYPQRCGATIEKFCAAMGINKVTYFRWLNKDTFATALQRARETFTATAVEDVENALARAARGAEFAIVVEKRKLNKTTGKLETVEATRKTFYEKPDVDAVKFFLTNIKGDDWRLKQEQTIKAEAPVFVVKTEAERKKLEDIAEGQ